jgi:hypothetical protein
MNVVEHFEKWIITYSAVLQKDTMYDYTYWIWTCTYNAQYSNTALSIVIHLIFVTLRGYIKLSV